MRPSRAMFRLIAARKHADRVRRKRADKLAAMLARQIVTAGWHPYNPLDRT